VLAIGGSDKIRAWGPVEDSVLLAAVTRCRGWLGPAV